MPRLPSLSIVKNMTFLGAQNAFRRSVNHPRESISRFFTRLRIRIRVMANASLGLHVLRGCARMSAVGFHVPMPALKTV